MRSTLKMVGVLLCVLLGLVVFAVVKETLPKIKKAAREPNAVDDFIGKTAVDRYLDIQEKSESFNLPALRTSIMMFYTENGRYPQSMQELEDRGGASSSVTRDKRGALLDLQITNQEATITSPGNDRIFGTTDDISNKIRL
jgi:hypothetical protein